ncbi:MAG: homoserine dehydrogenase [Deltaproteobacteria bacterium RBG_16_42_7]|nr:MAG: homoserine dehydrogenase [Deltaproteobacteria bacterium RBG_16_42_7]
MKKSVSVGIIGFGTVGTGVVKILLKKSQELENKLGFPLIIGKIADIDIKRKRNISVPANILVTDGMEVIEDPAIDIVVELIGGIHPAKEYILKALKRRKHVVTANKALLATEGSDIFKVARENNVELGFEAAVAGGIPIIKIVREALIGNKIQAIYGIINGTSNYILTKMTGENLDFATALKEAQALGYAEADPTLDIGGIDAAHKLALLGSLSFGMKVDLKKIYTEGITKITPLDINFASEFGYTIKLLAIAKQISNEIELRVHPTMLPKEHLISNVNGVFNAVYVEGDSIGPALFYGKGAGEMPTGSAVVSDIADIARNIKKGAINRIQEVGFMQKAGFKIKKMEDVQSCYYFRFSVLDKPGVLSKISGILGKNNISIKSVIQKGRRKEKAVPLVMMTHKAKERDVVYAMKEINKLPVVSGKPLYIRVEGGEE